MTALSTTLFVLALVASVIDWWAVARARKIIEYFAKPSAAALFALAALAIDASNGGAQAWRVIALVFCIAGDVFLMLPRDAFVSGLASFAVAQILFTVSFGLEDPTTTRFVIGLLVVILGAVLLARRFVTAIVRTGDRSLVPAIVVYVSVISAMATSAIAGGAVVAIVGALLFMASDSLIAEEKFVAAKSWHRLTIIVTYHLALAGLVLGLV